MEWFNVSDKLPEADRPLVVRLKNNGWGGAPTYATAVLNNWSKEPYFELDDAGIELCDLDDSGIGAKLESEVVKWAYITE